MIYDIDIRTNHETQIATAEFNGCSTAVAAGFEEFTESVDYSVKTAEERKSLGKRIADWHEDGLKVRLQW